MVQHDRSSRSPARSARLGLAVVTALSATAAQIAVADPALPYAPAAHDDFPTEVFWGDTHVHSSFSVDANSMGNTRLSPADAYRFAKGEAVVANNGMTARLEAPLDFLVVSDHAEYMGLLPALRSGNEALLADPVGRRLAEGVRGDEVSQYAVISEVIASLMSSKPIVDNAAFKRSIWDEITRLADEADEPGRFSALIGFEWSAMPAGDNLHRVVVPRRGQSRRRKEDPAFFLRRRAAGRPMGFHGGVRSGDRRRDPRHPAQPQHEQRPDVLPRAERRPPLRPRLRPSPCAARTDRRDHPDQGR